MRSIEQGFAGATKFCGFYENSKETKVFKVAGDSMIAASKKLHCNDKVDEVISCAVSVYGTWQKRGYASLNDCVAALFIDTGKILDIEAMSR